MRLFNTGIVTLPSGEIRKSVTLTLIDYEGCSDNLEKLKSLFEQALANLPIGAFRVEPTIFSYELGNGIRARFFLGTPEEFEGIADGEFEKVVENA